MFMQGSGEVQPLEKGRKTAGREFLESIGGPGGVFAIIRAEGGSWTERGSWIAERVI